MSKIHYRNGKLIINQFFKIISLIKLNIYDFFRNGESWYHLRHSVQRLMMRPHAAAPYLPAQNHVCDQFINYIKKHRDEKGEIEDFYELLLKYTMEC